MFNKTKVQGTPDFSFEKLTDITPSDIRKMGADAVALDIDKTVTFFGSMYIPSEARKWIKEIENAGIPIMLVSNTLTPRATWFSLMLGNIPYFAPAFKPGTIGIRSASRKLGISEEKIAVIGDKLTSDILAANRSGSIAVKVEPLLRADVVKKYVDTFSQIAEVAKAIVIINR